MLLRSNNNNNNKNNTQFRQGKPELHRIIFIWALLKKNK